MLMKRHVALILTIMLVSLTACGGASKGTEQAAPAEASAQDEAGPAEAPAQDEAEPAGVSAQDEAEPGEVSAQEETAPAEAASQVESKPAEEAHAESAASLPYWTEGSAVADSIISYVDAVTDEASDSYVEPEERIAIFDFDGTLYGERYPTYFDTCLFIHRVLHDESFTAPEEIREYAAAMEEALYNYLPEPDSDKSTAQCAAECFKGMTVEEYREYVRNFMSVPVFGFEGMTYGEGFYKPMTEVVRYLSENGFTIFISSGSERAMVRELIRGTLDEWIPSDRVIGSTFSLIASGQGSKAGRKYTITADDRILMEGNLLTKNQNTNKVFSIIDEIGHCPVLVFGNSSGDLAMARYVLQHGGRGYMLLCDDTERDYGDPEVTARFSDSCEQMGLETISMKNDFATIYGDNAVKAEQSPEEEEQSAGIQEQAPETQEQPSETEEQPVETREQPGETEEQPAETREQPGETEESPVQPREQIEEQELAPAA